MKKYLFGAFEFREETGELLRNGANVRLQPQPAKILKILLARPGELVLRQELARALWGEQVFTDVEQGLNIAVKKLRVALGDSAEQPGLIETLPRRGYRFIGTIEPVTSEEEARATQDILPAPKTTAEAPVVKKWWRWTGRTVLVGAACLVALLAWKYSEERARKLNFSAQDTLVVAQFKNETGESVLTGVIETALEAELTETGYVTIASPERVADALRLMRRPVTSRVPSDLAREVCQRDPGIRAVVAGGVRKVGEGYLLWAEIIRPGDWRAVTAVSRNAKGKNELLEAVRGLGGAILRRLGEEAPDLGPKQASPEKVTPRSLHALTLYTEATALGKANKWEAAEVLLRQAVEEDPEFASAHNLLAWAILNQGRGAGEFMPSAERALSLAGTTTDREAYFIRGSYHSLRQEHLQAQPYYEALYRQYPDHPWGGGNLLSTYRTLGNRSADSLVRDSLTLRPNNPGSYWENAGLCFCELKQDMDRVGGLVERATELTRQQGDPDDLNRALWRRAAFRALIAWAAGDMNRCKAELDRHRELPAPSSERPLLYIAAGYVTIGELREAEGLLQRMPASLERARWQMWRALLAGDASAAARLAVEQNTLASHPNNVIVLLRAGHESAALRMLKRRDRPLGGWPPVAAEVEEGELAFQQGHTDKAIEVLTHALGSERIAYVAEYLIGAQTLAGAFKQRGDIARAAEVLERITSERQACNGFFTAAFWPQARYDLMQLYIKQKRGREAEAIRKELEESLKFADANHVVKARLAGMRPGGG